MNIPDSPDLQMSLVGLMRCSCDIPVWGILLVALAVLCLFVFFMVTILNCKKAIAECNRARTQADTDELTGLWSRHAMNRALQGGQHCYGPGLLHCSVIFIDINGLKLINDECGHLVGDCVLKIFAQQLSRAIRCSDYACRWGGDEFLVLVPDMRSKADIAALCKKIEQETSTTVTIDNRPVAIRASFGYALAKVDGGTVADLIKVADMRMYKNKRHSSAGFRWCKMREYEEEQA